MRVFISTLLLLLPIAAFAEDGDGGIEWAQNNHTLSLTYEGVQNQSLGLRYLQTYEYGAKGPTQNLVAWLSYGIRPRYIVSSGHDALGGDVTGVISSFSHTGGAAFELSAGLLKGEKWAAAFSGGLFFSMLFFDVGYVFQIATADLDAVSTHQVGFRINVPVYSYNRKETTL